jgi:hypothetical protein
MYSIIDGGNSESEAVGCSGGRRSSACFSARLMWRGAGQGEFYTYLPPYTDSRFAANKKQCNVAPESDCNPTYGASIGRGSFSFATGGWTTVSERVKLNDVGKANGELQLFVNGKSVIDLSGLILRDSAAGRMRGIQMQTFFGGAFGFLIFHIPSTDVSFLDRFFSRLRFTQVTGRVLLRLLRRHPRHPLNDRLTLN